MNTQIKDGSKHFIVYKINSASILRILTQVAVCYSSVGPTPVMAATLPTESYRVFY